MDTDKRHAGEQEPGGYGTPTPEQETAGRTAATAEPGEERRGSTPGASGSESAEVPSAEADMDGSNTEQPESGRPFSSEPKGDATGLPDEKSPKDDDGERFDAG